MKRQEIIDRVAAGLRRMERKPDALIFIDMFDWVWDEKEILEVPVYHTIKEEWKDYTEFNSIPFIPLWGGEEVDRLALRGLFNLGYTQEAYEGMC